MGQEALNCILPMSIETSTLAPGCSDEGSTTPAVVIHGLLISWDVAD